MTSASLTPVILSGGSGTRLWPLSHPGQPKQFIALTAPATMFELTVARTRGLDNCVAPIIVANASHEALVSAQLSEPATIILEPCARNTAPAIAIAAYALADPDSPMLVMPSDHVIADLPAFHAAIAAARPIAEQGWLVTFGITPDRPETGYGYIALADPIAPGVQKVDRFIEKPDLQTAQALLEAGNHVWNAGIFLFSGRAFLDALAAHEPDMAREAARAMEAGTKDGQVFRPDAAAFAACPSNSIDYAVMERAEKVACVPVSMGWSDVGSWDSLYDIAEKDETGNVLVGRAQSIDAKGCLIRSEGPRITVVGAEDLVVIAMKDEIMIVPRGRTQDVKKAAELNKS